jgi:hypothetical protein
MPQPIESKNSPEAAEKRAARAERKKSIFGAIEKRAGEFEAFLREQLGKNPPVKVKKRDDGRNSLIGENVKNTPVEYEFYAEATGQENVIKHVVDEWKIHQAAEVGYRTEQPTHQLSKKEHIWDSEGWASDKRLINPNLTKIEVQGDETFNARLAAATKSFQQLKTRDKWQGVSRITIYLEPELKSSISQEINFLNDIKKTAHQEVSNNLKKAIEETSKKFPLLNLQELLSANGQSLPVAALNSPDSASQTAPEASLDLEQIVALRPIKNLGK